MEFARQPASKTKEPTLEMDVDMPSAVILKELAIKVGSWTSRVHAVAVGLH